MPTNCKASRHVQTDIRTIADQLGIDYIKLITAVHGRTLKFLKTRTQPSVWIPLQYLRSEKTGRILGLVLAVGLATIPAHSWADTITFDDLVDTGVGTPIPNGYHGLNWNNFYVMNTPAFGILGGYMNGTVSAPNVAFNGFGIPAAFSGGTFMLHSFFLMGDGGNGFNATITGFLGGVQQFQQTFVLDTTGPTLQVLSWSGIDEVTWVTFNSIIPGLPGNFVIDNLTINAAPVPEPSSLALLGAGLIGLGYFRRRNA